jgi:hypothetical protein
MRLRAVWVFAIQICLFANAPARAQFAKEKWELTPFVGYETSGSYPLNPQTSGVTINDLRIDGAASLGTFIDYSLTSNAQAEFMWDRNLTSYNAQPFPGAPYFKAYDSSVTNISLGCCTCS